MTQADVLARHPQTRLHFPWIPRGDVSWPLPPVGSMVSAGNVAAAALTPNDVPQAVTTPTGSPSPELRAAIRVLAKAHEALIVAKANDDEADAMFRDWEAKNLKPASKRGTRKWLKIGCAYHSSVTAP